MQDPIHNARLRGEERVRPIQGITASSFYVSQVMDCEAQPVPY